MIIDKSMEKQYTLLVDGLTLEEKSWLYNRAKKDGTSQGVIALNLIKQAMLDDESNVILK